MGYNKFFYLLKKIDWLLLMSVLLLVSFGLAAIYSIALSGGEANFFSFKKQLTGVFVGLIVLFFMTATDYKVLRVYNKILYILSLFLLIGVLFFGQTLKGTTGWFVISGFGFQPVEFVKIFLIIFLSYYFSKIGRHAIEWKQIMVSGVFVFLLCGLVLVQPDFGSAAILFAIWFGLICIRGIKAKTFITLMLIFSVLFSFAWFFGLQDYQKDRLMTFINPDLDPLGSGYNITQATIAVGSGMLSGRGLGLGSQSQLKFLPASQTDFIFAVIAEELGLIGVALILGFWVLFFWRLAKAAQQCRSDFSLNLILGIIILFLAEITVNIGMNLGVMPVTGITLPFVSLGSSSLVSSMAAIGIMQSIISRS